MNFHNNYNEYFIHSINLLYNQDFKDRDKAHSFFLNIQSRDKSRLWKQIGKLADATQKQISDYYYNTWSKQFCDDLSKYKREIHEYIKSLPDSLSVKETYSTTNNYLKKKHPQLVLHYQTFYQHITYLVKHNYKNGKIRSIETSNSSMTAKIDADYTPPTSSSRIIEKLDFLVFDPLSDNLWFTHTL